MKIIHERQKCIGCGSCAALCPKYWEMAEDGKARFLNSKKNQETKKDELEVQEISCNREASESCPVQIIHLVK